MQSFKRILGGVNARYMVRAYLIGALFLALIIYTVMQGNKAAAGSAGTIAYFSLCLVVFPFAKLVWDELKALVLGDTFLILPMILLYPAKLLINVVLFSFAVFIAPFGVAYIWYQTK
ncbi:hypothetical protein ACFOHK_15850 [Falsigemmobacter intermedius]|uniref:Uncharacterized protein n=1 Tax=Falsigemmobacter intermedius TaxID=1553448 RepID=A0A444M8W7_9RHOB|nr:hypothetical protein [Falsigemmobacter intermedius]RWY39105.1 hypothetical protein EP867_14940 [Falsigemmobacter intermedius]